MIDDEFSSQILPDDYDVFMGNFPLPLPRIGERLLKVKYLGPAKWTTESELFPVHGLLHDHSRYIISLTCSLDHNPDYSKRIIFVVDTGSPFTYLTQEAIRALYEPPEVYDGRLDTFDVFIHVSMEFFLINFLLTWYQMNRVRTIYYITRTSAACLLKVIIDKRMNNASS